MPECSNVCVAMSLVALLVSQALFSSATGAQESAVAPLSASQAPSTQASNAKAPEHSFPDLSIPPNADEKTLDEIVTRAKSARPHTPQEYQAMQTALRDASKQLMSLLKGKEHVPRYQQAELDAISGAVALMTYFGEDAKKKTLEQVHAFLKARKKLSMPDIQTGMLAAAMLELQPDKQPAHDTYKLLDELLEKDEREEMQSLRLNLQAAIRRLGLLGNKFELDIESLDGSRVKIDDLAGKYVVVDFFATWCEPCLAEVPRIQKHYAKYKDKGLAVIGISLDENTKSLKAYLERAQLPWPVIHDDAADELDRLQMKFGISQLPTVLLLNKEGTVVSLEARGAELDRLVQMLFEAPTPAPPQQTAPVAQPAASTTDSRLDRK